VNKRKIVKWTTFLVLILALALSLGDSAMRVRGSGNAATPIANSESGILERGLPRRVTHGVARAPRLSRRADIGSADIARTYNSGALDAANGETILGDELTAEAFTDADGRDAAIGDAINGAAVTYSESAFASGGAGGNTYPLYGGAGIIASGGSGTSGSGGGGSGGDGGGGGVILPPATTPVGVPEPSSLILLCAELLTLFAVARRIRA
jgi:hypothetical protein